MSRQLSHLAKLMGLHSPAGPQAITQQCVRVKHPSISGFRPQTWPVHSPQNSSFVPVCPAQRPALAAHFMSVGASTTPSRSRNIFRSLCTKTTESQPPVAKSWIQSLPPSAQPYLYLVRADKPIGTWLLLWPCCWSIAIAAPVGCLPDMLVMAKFATGAVVMRGAGCTINDMWDRKIDNQVERTRSRPIAAGLISQRQALVFLAVQLTAGLGVLLSLNVYSIVLGAGSMILVVVYPLMKRCTHWPQLVLGLAFNWGALLGASAVLGSCPWAVCLPMYLGSVAWTIVYDTIYAHQDKKDDRLVGVKSTALLFGNWTKPVIAGFSTCFIGGLGMSGIEAGLGSAFYASLGAASAHLGWQIITVDLDNQKDCMQKFISNFWLGLFVACGIIVGKLQPS